MAKHEELSRNFQGAALVLLVLAFSVFSFCIPSSEALSAYSTRAEDSVEHYGGEGINGYFPDGRVGEHYNDYDSVKVMYNKCTWDIVDGNLPPGLKLARFGFGGGAHAELEGTPTRSGTYSFTVLVTFSDNSSLTKDFSVTILDNPNVRQAVIVGSFAAGKVNTPYSSSITVSNGSAPYDWEYDNDDLPQGLRFKSSSSGTLTLSGIPRERGEFTFMVSVRDKYSFAEPKFFTIVIK